MKLSIGIVLLAVMALSSCKEEKGDPASQAVMKEVLAVHDEIMPKMDNLGKLVAELKSKIDTSEDGKSYEKAMKDLQQSHKAMMDWMQDFGTRFEPEEIMNNKALSEQKQKWLAEEEANIKALRDQVNNCIENAEKLLNGS